MRKEKFVMGVASKAVESNRRTEQDRKRCDKKFYDAMVKDCSTLPWYQYLRYRPWCFIYYQAVKKFGKKYFQYAGE